MKGALDPVWDTPLSAEEFSMREAQSVASVLGPDGEPMREFMDWFCRRYPTPLARLRYIRRQMDSMKLGETR